MGIRLIYLMYENLHVANARLLQTVIIAMQRVNNRYHQIKGIESALDREHRGGGGGIRRNVYMIIIETRSADACVENITQISKAYFERLYYYLVMFSVPGLSAMASMDSIDARSIHDFLVFRRQQPSGRAR